jgi:receptor protein-tyrosine kinase
VLPFDGEDPRAAEQYRIARTKIIQHPNSPRMIVVSSAGPGDGKTLSSINLAGALALKTEQSVLLIDADFRRSAVHQRLGLPASPGLTDVLDGSIALEEALVRTEQFPNLYVLPAGAQKTNPTELLDSSRWRALTAVLRNAFQFVIADSTPIWAVADYELIETVCDGVLLIARPDHTPRKAFLQAVASIPNQKLIGVLLNWVPKWFLGRSYHYDAPYYYQANGKEKE